MVDDTAVAVSNVNPNAGGDHTATLNTIVRVEAGQSISLFWTRDCSNATLECSYIAADDGDIFTHWTGEYLGSGTQFFPHHFKI